jgi:hypothetical protein
MLVIIPASLNGNDVSNPVLFSKNARYNYLSTSVSTHGYKMNVACAATWWNQ